jgi:hypothetical protein
MFNILCGTPGYNLILSCHLLHGAVTGTHRNACHMSRITLYQWLMFSFKNGAGVMLVIAAENCGVACGHQQLLAR